MQQACRPPSLVPVEALASLFDRRNVGASESAPDRIVQLVAAYRPASAAVARLTVCVPSGVDKRSTRTEVRFKEIDAKT